MSPCPQWNDAVLDAALGQPRGKELEQHLAVCAACAGALGEWKARSGQLDAALSQVTAGEPPAYAAGRALAHITAQPPARYRWWAVPAALAVAAALIAVVVGMRFTSQRGLPPAPAAAITEWQSPTKWLLVSASSPLLSDVPRLGKDLPPARNSGEKNVR